MITYENKIHSVIDKIASIISTEMTGIPLSFDEHRGNQSLLIVPQEDSLLEIISRGQSRQYSILISYELATSGQYSENNFKQISNVSEHIKRLFAPDNNANVSGYWHDGQIESVSYERDVEENDKIRSLIIFTCKNMESL